MSTLLENICFPNRVLIFYKNTITLSTTNTAAHANNATVSKLFSLYAKYRATANPTAPLTTLDVVLKIAGNVIAASQA